jgi:putative flippase GtrA
MISIINKPAERTRFLKFMAVGTFGAVVDFGIANVLTHFFDMPLVYAGTISFTCAVISNFIWNRYWTYPESRSRALPHQLGMFFLVNVAGIVIRIPILRYAEPPLRRLFEGWWAAGLSKPMPITPEFAARNLTLAVAVGIVMLWNFFVNRYWTYNDIS